MKAPKAITVSIFGPKHESDAPQAATSLTVEQLNGALKPHGWQAADHCSGDIVRT